MAAEFGQSEEVWQSGISCGADWFANSISYTGVNERTDDDGRWLRALLLLIEQGAMIALAGFFRLQDVSYQVTRHDACKVRVTGYLLSDDDHNGSADVGSTVQYFSKNGFHHPWRSTAWEIHPIIKIEVVE